MPSPTQRRPPRRASASRAPAAAPEPVAGTALHKKRTTHPATPDQAHAALCHGGRLPSTQRIGAGGKARIVIAGPVQRPQDVRTPAGVVQLVPERVVPEHHGGPPKRRQALRIRSVATSASVEPFVRPGEGEVEKELIRQSHLEAKRLVRGLQARDPGGFKDGSRARCSGG